MEEWLSDSILVDVRKALNLSADDSSFDSDITMHINSAIGKINQVGVGNSIVVRNDSETWNDLYNSFQVNGNKLFKFIPTFIFLSTKMIFDPPPPSLVEQYQRQCDELLWRLKVAYEGGDEL